MAADKLYSAGARYERAALREHLERLIKKAPNEYALSAMLKWVKSRQARYDKKPGGL